MSASPTLKLISVVMPAYNADPFISQAIDSVLAQTWRDFELIVVDDGSTDRTLEIAKRYAAQDVRIKVYSHPNKGTAPTLNRCIELASSEWVFLMHADDLMRPNRLERQLAFVREHPELAVASSLVWNVDSKDRIIGKATSEFFTHEAVDKSFSANKPIGFHHPAVALRKSAVLSVGGYRQEFWPAEDMDLWNRLVGKGYKILVQPEYLLYYRMHGNAASISRARLTCNKAHWVADCMHRRREGAPELEWESFLRTRRSAPMLIRLNRERKDLAEILYKTAVLHYARRNYLGMIATLVGSVLLRPITLRKVISKATI
jgi:glycosyltransferase involved in cell wall biosynthesis